MNVKTELLKAYISDYINYKIEDFDIDANKIADTTAISMLIEIQNILKNDTYTDFEIVDKIIYVFNKYNIDCGNPHDFG